MESVYIKQEEVLELVPVCIKQEMPELEPVHIKEETELEPVHIKEEETELEPVHIKEEETELEPVHIKEEETELDPGHIKEEETELEPVHIKEESIDLFNDSENISRPKISHQCTECGKSFNELASTVELAVKAALDSVVCAITEAVGSKFTLFQVEMSGLKRENETLKLRLEISESELKAVRGCINAADAHIKQPFIFQDPKESHAIPESEAQEGPKIEAVYKQEDSFDQEWCPSLMQVTELTFVKDEDAHQTSSSQVSGAVNLVPKPLSCPLVPTSTIPHIKPPMGLTATICRPTEEKEDGDPGKPERGKGGQRKEAIRNVYNEPDCCTLDWTTGLRPPTVERSQDSWHRLLKPGQPLQCSPAKCKQDQKNK
ncbi:UNVERIFIED_CONTAM: hypothetical protein FKN15_027597 [Acipenser sinensis]